MALVCDTKSEEVKEEKTEQNDDLEDGEIEDDDEPTELKESNEVVKNSPRQSIVNKSPEHIIRIDEKFIRDRVRDRPERLDRRKYDDKKKHLTEAEKSILELKKRERMQREKYEKYRKDQSDDQDDFASNLEKTLAYILKKDRPPTNSDEEKEEDKNPKKRKKHEKDLLQKNKIRKIDARWTGLSESEPTNVKVDGAEEEKLDKLHFEEPHGSPEPDFRVNEDNFRNHRKKDKKRNIKNKKDHLFKKQDRNRDKRGNSDNVGPELCTFFLQGNCQKSNCLFLHDLSYSTKSELCKFYMMDCCAKGDKCTYMHSDFPCKFHHTGLPCPDEGDCKFSHGNSLTDGLKQILLKHIESAPRDILGGFPRVSRDEVLRMIDDNQKKLLNRQEIAFKGDTVIPSLFDINVALPFELLRDSHDKKQEKRHKPSRWQDSESFGDNCETETNVKFMKPFHSNQDLDMRITSNGDVDMRTLPPHPMQNISQSLQAAVAISQHVASSTESGADNCPVPLVTLPSDVDIRQPNFEVKPSQDMDIRQLPATSNATEEEPIQDGTKQSLDTSNFPSNLPKTQRALFLRIQAQQKDNVLDTQVESPQTEVPEVNWYSDDDDDDDNRLMIKVDSEKEEENSAKMEASLVAPNPSNLVEKIGDLSKIDISAEVTKLLSTISQSTNNLLPKDSKSPPSKNSISEVATSDIKISSELLSPEPKKSRKTEQAKPEKISIYEQGSVDVGDVEIQATKYDMDLHNLQLSFKSLQNYTPATEIDASISTHVPLPWKILLVDIPKPDYTGLKLTVSDAEKSGDPRLRKIFRLSVEERDSPTSPKMSPKTTGISTRSDPRIKKPDDPKPVEGSSVLSYTQQLNLLQSSAFYQSLSSSQKLMLNQELAAKSDQSGSHDPLLNTILTNLNLMPRKNVSNSSELQKNPNLAIAMNIFQNIAKPNNPLVNNPSNTLLNSNPVLLNQNPSILNQMNQSIVQPGLLGAAPGIPNLPPDFSMNFDPRSNLLGNSLPFNSFNEQNNFNNYNEDFFPENNSNNFPRSNRNERNFNNRERRRGRNNFNRNASNRNFRSRSNRGNRSYTPP